MGEAAAYRRKIGGFILLVFAMGIFLPFFSLRTNRIVEAASFPVWDSRLPWFYLVFILLPPGFVLITLFYPGDLLWRIIGNILPVLTPLAAFGFLIGLERLFGDSLGKSGRLGLGLGFYLYFITGFFLILSGDKHRTRSFLLLLLVLMMLIIGYTGGYFDHLGIVKEAHNQSRRLKVELFHHLQLTFISVGLSAFVGIPLALLSFLKPRLRKISFPVINILQTVPSIALFGLMIAPLAAVSRAVPFLRQLGIRGIGNTPAVIALSLYALYPIIRYSFTAFSTVDDKVIDAARGMGMSKGQLWKIIRLPLSLPIILHGVRIAIIQTLGNAVLAKLVGGNGLGVFVFEGLGQASTDMVLLGMLLIILLTLAVDQIMHGLIGIITPAALRRQYQSEQANE